MNFTRIGKGYFIRFGENYLALNRRMYASEIVAEMISCDGSLAESCELGHSFLAELDSIDFAASSEVVGEHIATTIASG